MTEKGMSLAQNDPASDESRQPAEPTWSEVDAPDQGSKASLAGSDVMGTQPAAEVEALYRSHQRPMVQLARLLTGSPAVAEEIVQEAFIKFARSAGKKDEPAAYLRVIVVNLARSQQRRTVLERRVAPEAPVLSGIAEVDETWSALRRLPFRQRAALMLRYYEDLPEADIARLLGCRPGTVKSALHRGLASLRKELGDTNEEREGRSRDA